MKGYNSVSLGAVIGVVMAVISIMAIYLIQFTDLTITEYFTALFQNKRLFAPVVSIAGIPNLGIFYLFINKNKYQSARGIILATFILVVIVILIKVLL